MEHLRPILDLALAYVRAHPGEVALGLVTLGAIVRRVRWSPEHLWVVSRSLYRIGAHGRGFGAFLASLLVPPAAVVETGALPLAIAAGFRPRVRDRARVVGFLDALGDLRRDLDRFAARLDHDLTSRPAREEVEALADRVRRLEEDFAYAARRRSPSPTNA